MDNPQLEFLNSHGSVRQFTGREITADEERIIVTTAQRSPTSSNLQAYSIISIRDQAGKTELCKLCGGQEHVATCSLFLVFVADLYRLKRLADKRGYPFHGDYTDMFIMTTVDAALVAGRALQAAQAIGLGGVMVGSLRNHAQKAGDLIGLPESTYPVMGMSLGTPLQAPKVKPRLPTEAICFREGYKTDGVDAAIEAYDKTMDELGYLKGREFNKADYPHLEGRYSWSEHSARRMANRSPQAHRPDMLSYLRKRGFLIR